ncbi:MFS transporter [Acidithiobacillus sulfuriphilus]|uniref:MFS transporter n=2 Tax=Acidithiobacillus sulfuriphilus TaxID=1867749 RepID=A0ACD5HNK5_9PROT|nr:MFS transporter [Acidithiobacillus sulfuriphilus]
MILAGIPPTARRLMAARAARSVGQGALVVDFALYLHALHWTALAIGAVYSASLLLGALATLLVGPASDHFGAKGFLLGYEGLQLACAGIALSSANPWWLGAAAIAGAFGRGANGGAGPFAPAEQSWLSRSMDEGLWGQLFNLNTAVGLFGMGLGAVLAGLPDLLSPWLPGTLAYRPLFAVVLLGSLLCLAFLWSAKEGTPPARTLPEDADQRPDAAPAPPPPWRNLFTLAGINALNGLGVGMVGPLMAYWFALRFGVGPAAIGGTMAVGFVAAGIMSLAGGKLTLRFGLVGTVLRLRMLGLAMLLIIPFVPFFWLATMLYILRAALNQGSIGSRQALFLSLVDSRRRGLAATFNSISIQVPRAIGPAVAGAFFHLEMLTTPFLLAAAFQGAYLWLYRRFFRGKGIGQAPGAD